jgi:hypothetical protein
MTIHLIKLSVGPQSLIDLEARQKSYLKSLKEKNKKPELMHITRQMPKRAEELLDGGSIYWVIKGWVCARQKLIELRPLVIDDIPHCGLVFENELIRVSPRPRRPFQGWRYLEAKDAPPDISQNEYHKDLPETLLAELMKIGLI